MAVDAQLKDWGASKPNSTMIAFIAVNSPEKKLFIQWPNGTGNIYSDVDMLTLNGIVTATSAGKFFHAAIKDKFESEKITSPLISLAPDDDEDYIPEGSNFADDEDDDLFFGEI